ncbi:MAG: mandelate racemase/muconate lactonizing enzyme family protein [Gorillibacterium sp.]|nr:mandelate racemase/muconate lactonizing enzyme family protein [Gorillibacterium sp.]
MQITNIVTYLAPGTIYVKVETDQGISGYGECSRMGREALLPIINHFIFPAIQGLNPVDIELIEHKVMLKNYKVSGQLLAMAFSGVEMALWEIKALLWEEPLFRLLGGKFRHTLPFYGSSMSRDLPAEQEAEKVTEAIERNGFEAVKIKVGPRMGTGELVDLSYDVHRVAVMRKTIGPNIKLMLDANSSYTYAQATQFFSRVMEYDIFHYEEPCPYYDVEAYVKLAQLPVPIHVGEQDWNIFTFRDFLSKGACDLYAPDLVKCGGFLSAKRCAALCRAFGIIYAPHNTSRGLGLAATIQLAAATPECQYYYEYKIGQDPSELYLERPFVISDGNLSVPEGIGYGVKLDLEKMERTMTLVSALG